MNGHTLSGRCLGLFLCCLVVAGLAFGGEAPANPPKRRPPPDKQGPGAAKPQNPYYGKVRVVTDKVIDRAVKKGVSSVYFWASWCGPCRLQGPIMEDMAKKYAGKVKVLKMDVDSELETREKYGISQVPTTILFKNGKPIMKMIGLIDADEYSEEVDALMKPPQKSAQGAVAGK